MTYTADTRIVEVDPHSSNPAAIARAARLLKQGALVAFPTETVYGLGANALDADAVRHIYEAKGRPASDPLIVHIAALDQLEQVAENIPSIAHVLTDRFWPGPLTLVLRRSPAVPPIVSAGGPTVAVRMPRHPIALALLLTAGVPVAAPSANRFARPSPTTAQHVLDDLNGHVDLILDGGPTKVGVESTVLDLTGDRPMILRPGGVSLEALRDLIPTVQHVERYAGTDETVVAPGMLLKHYSPRAELLLFDGPTGAVIEAMRTRAQSLIASGKRVGLMLLDDEAGAFADLDAERIALGSSADLDHVARMLFAALRDLDGRGVDAILTHTLPRTGVGLAIGDRLLRAAEGRVIHVE